MVGKVVFIGSGPGDPELITVKAKKYIETADVIVYAGSLVNPEILKWSRKDAEVYNSSSLTLNEIVEIMVKKASEGKLVVRLKSGDSSIYGALFEEMWALEAAGIPFEVVPGITAAIAAASVIPIELTVPKLSQTVIITRASLRVPMQGSIKDFAKMVKIGATMVIYTGIHIIDRVVNELKEGGLTDDTPVIVVYRATWPEQRIIKGTLADIVSKVREAKIYRDSVIIVGLASDPQQIKNMVRSSVYDPKHNHSYRPWKVEED
ncbi:precorrin-4 C11-methyltransferase [Sulfolobus islandicus Y.G.57.14]|jgi:precorrin-4/cobalt-precorrin-4 C11-methyltransferase|uniref:uroporphyrinogen-III C-methyltransferase n=5 Tax=Saccharolobus islandicus TaxID=43080 RepID=M9U673_SACIS|nr:precorrin-4 C(11)-methyltransferase [Sulfolobus islandicus]ACP44404.1 precorrin-4 C11-methyltransferase [Sulfolobus islandicus Y.G.57.14]ACP54137.1 precorrin-4 C11-methyltransferase [Sulfolobus islandicus M.16.27]ACR40746.1 precorrin-4 C11-methyltransferase [Sulfolobus islandicus M.16.4]ADX81481.1 precorrin-4 C11-methyltransferase [Sulfolobus islandicus HVE10/4]AGJ61588.1 Precorrin-4 methylase [Sulfolobus islandicus LAL14/1]